MDRETFVYLHKDERGAPILIGRLWSRVRKDKESATFEYDKDWLSNVEKFALEPALKLAAGPYHTQADKPMFGAIGDSAPDRWGRSLMRRAERKRAEQEKRQPRTLFEIDYLLLVDDEVRPGALRFSETMGGPFLAPPKEGRVPPLVNLGRLLSAAERVGADKEDEEDLRMLIAPGSSLGGARPKASVRDNDGHLSIAKFPKSDDENNVVVWEYVAHVLAGKAGIAVPQTRIETAAGKPVLLVRRFDRQPHTRIPFVSAMSMLDARDNDRHSYFEIVDVLRQFGASPDADMKQLWRRVVFNILISNTDDHLRNHGFLYEGQGGWRLSPAYDMNPTPIEVKARVLSTSISGDDDSASLELAFQESEYFGVEPKEARQVASEVAKAVSGWRDVSARAGIKKAEADRMASAFEHDDLKQAAKV